ncbi:MAG: enoyl-CoA hydratase/isomerase family protein [Promethearchaeota archaeon]
MDFGILKWELREDGIGILTLNRPERLNAMSIQLVEDLNDLFDHLMINLDCRVVIMRGEGKAFCAGLDLKESSVLQKRKVPEEYQKFQHINIPEGIKRTYYYQARMSQIILKMRRISQPIIAIINGSAVGGGFTLTMAADIRIASENAKFSVGAINIGMSGGDLGGSYFLPRLIGMSRAAEILYTGKFIDASEAERNGYVLKVVKKEELLNSAIELAKEMLHKSPLGLRLTKEAINLSLNSPSLTNAINLDNRAQTICSVSKDMVEAAQAFYEKRNPKYALR